MRRHEDYRGQAEECERLAASCVWASNRTVLLIAARQWRRMADKDAEPESPAFLKA